MKRGTELELIMVKHIFKNEGIGFRAPGSGTYVVENHPIPYSELQEKCKFEITNIDFVDFGYDPKGYQTCDYAGFFTKKSLSRVTSYGEFSSHEFRFVELKTVRLRSSHLTRNEKSCNRNDIDRKSHVMKTIFNLLQKDTRKWIRKNGEKIPNPYYMKLRKSDFCMELQRTWYMELLMKENVKSMLRTLNIDVDTTNLPIHAYLQVRFIGAGCEIWIKIEDLAKYQDHNKNMLRDTTCTMLDIIKNEKNEIIWKWRKNKNY